MPGLCLEQSPDKELPSGASGFGSRSLRVSVATWGAQLRLGNDPGPIVLKGPTSGCLSALPLSGTPGVLASLGGCVCVLALASRQCWKAL